MQVPFFRLELGNEEIGEVEAVLRSGWLTTGQRVAEFEKEFSMAVGARHAVALNSCTAALHVSLEALGVQKGEVVLVPTMTFAATAEVVRYMGGIPVLVDCGAGSLNMDLDDATAKIQAALNGELPGQNEIAATVAGVIAVHVGGLMMDVDAIRTFAGDNNIWVVEDAAHAFPAAWRPDAGSRWQRCGQGTADVSCFSFYANKTITTGEGGMAVTDSGELAERMRLMSLHGLSRDAWQRYSSGGSWDYQIVAPGFKYNMTDIAGALGVCQLRRAEDLRVARERIAGSYLEYLGGVDEIDLPARGENRIHSWHLFPIRLRPDCLKIGRNEFIDGLKGRGVGCSVHWRPLHLHPYYADLGWRPEHCPVATREWERVISLPLFPGMRSEEVEYVVETLVAMCRENRC